MHEQLDEYLKQVEKQLATLPVEQRRAEMRELHLHLQMMIEDYSKLGDSETEAVARALRQFGSSHRVGLALKRAQQQDNDRFWHWRLLWAGMAALTVQSMSFIGAMLLAFSVGYARNLGANDALWRVLSQLNGPLLLLGALVSGWVAESIAPRRALLPLILVQALIASAVIGGEVADSFMLLSIEVLASDCGLWAKRRWTRYRSQSTLMPRA